MTKPYKVNKPAEFTMKPAVLGMCMLLGACILLGAGILFWQFATGQL